jgi:hypothetical protein
MPLSKRLSLFLVILFLISAGFGFVPTTKAQVERVNSDEAAIAKFNEMWLYSDDVFLSGRAANNPPGRSWTWGPRINSNIFYEDYAEASGGKRRVIYHDKSRMEISPGGSFVTNGLLTKELVTGKRQDGDAKFTQLAPSTSAVAGDPNINGANVVAPTYATFQKVVSFNPGENSAPSRLGQVINQAINKAGEVSTLSTLPAAVKVGNYEPVLGHNVADVFYNFQQLKGEVWNGKEWITGPVYTANPTANVFGYAISEPFWSRAVVGGVEKDVLIQLFERRVLTYTPSNDEPFKVEMGNIGQHYFAWRYPNADQLLAKFSGTWQTNLGLLYLNQEVSYVNLKSFQGKDLVSSFVHVGGINGNLLTLNISIYDGTDTRTIYILLEARNNGQTFAGSIGLPNAPNPIEAFCGGRATDLPDGCGFSGKWNYVVGEGAPAVMQVVQQGDKLTASFSECGQNRQVSATTEDGQKATGSYSATGCTKVTLNEFSWSLTPDGILFQGNVNGATAWCGWRDGFAKPTVCFK